FTVREIFKTPRLKYFSHGVLNIMCTVCAKKAWFFVRADSSKFYFISSDVIFSSYGEKRNRRQENEKKT
ncbi:MAG: hypothetical protein IKD25_05870, partial [Bacteroidaceae bacterium]|nr:hypothetical protein [Bacteroidaceae bacterium]